MKSITIFTPTYNRAYILYQAYDSLVKQTSKDFKWLIIDDGSTDQTRQLVDSWIKDNLIDIEYQYKKNGGMHTAHNMAFELCDTELIFCLDSDDDMTHNAIEIILRAWKPFKDKAIAGIIAYEIYRNSGKIIGSTFPKNLKMATFYSLYYEYKITGDKALIYSTKYIKSNPYPKFYNEIFVPLDYKYLKIKNPLLIVRSRIIYKEYLSDGYTKNILKVYARNPKGFAFYHSKCIMSEVKDFKRVLKSAIHYVGCCRVSNEKNIILKSPLKLLTFLCFLPGVLWGEILKRVK